MSDDLKTARERLETQLHCYADEIRAWGHVVDAQLDPCIDALILAAEAQGYARGRAEERTIATQKDALIRGYEHDLTAAESKLAEQAQEITRLTHEWTRALAACGEQVIAKEAAESELTQQAIAIREKDEEIGRQTRNFETFFGKWAELEGQLHAAEAVLREVATNGEWQGGTDWLMSTAVYEMVQDQLRAAEARLGTREDK